MKSADVGVSSFDFTNLSRLQKIDDLAGSLVCELRPDRSRVQPAMQFLRSRIAWRTISNPTFYEWRKLAFVTDKRTYSGTALLYMEIIGLHLREWGSRPDASKAVAELLAWQLHLHGSGGIHFSDSAFALGEMLKENRSVSLAAGRLEEIVETELERRNHAC
jgi:hypothetical protein